MARPKIYTDYQLRKAYYFHNLTDDKTKPHYTEQEIRDYLGISHTSYVRQLMSQIKQYCENEEYKQAILNEFKDVYRLNDGEETNIVKYPENVAKIYLGNNISEDTMSKLDKLTNTITELKKSSIELCRTQQLIYDELKSQLDKQLELIENYNKQQFENVKALSQFVVNKIGSLSGKDAKHFINLPTILEHINRMNENIEKLIAIECGEYIPGEFGYTEPVAKPVVEPVVEPVAKPVAKPVVEPTAKSVIEQILEPVVEQILDVTPQPPVQPPVSPINRTTTHPYLQSPLIPYVKDNNPLADADNTQSSAELKGITEGIGAFNFNMSM